MQRLHQFFGVTVLACLFGASALAQTNPPSSSSGNGVIRQEQKQPSTSGRPKNPETAGASITLETNESLFDLAVGMNACGYDDDLANSAPVRTAVRSEVDSAVQASAAARLFVPV